VTIETPEQIETPQRVELDTRTVTLYELWQVEEASGRTVQQLVATTTGTLMLALYVSELRERRRSGSSEPMPSWQELGDRPVHAV